MNLLDDLEAADAYRQRAASLRNAALTVSSRKRARMLKEALDWEWRAACIEGTLITQTMQAGPKLPLVA